MARATPEQPGRRAPSTGERLALTKRAAALRYDREKDAVPRMVAKGQGKMAEKIIEVAREQGITIYEDPDLIELLTKLDVNQLIPQKLFVAVAEVMAYVYRLNHRADEIEKLRAEIEQGT